MQFRSYLNTAIVLKVSYISKINKKPIGKKSSNMWLSEVEDGGKGNWMKTKVQTSSHKISKY